MLKSDRNLTGNERFEGFCIDLLRTISDLLGFNYDLYLVPDNKFGAENTTTGEWSGLVKEIIEKILKLHQAKANSYTSKIITTYLEEMKTVVHIYLIRT
ncbi:Glutamate receptor, ionotropic kainate 1, partial [Stegodyphus mimosarum]